MLRGCTCSVRGGELPSQTPQRMGRTREQMGVMESDAPDTSHLLVLVPAAVILKASTTVTVLAKTMETATVQTTPNVTCGRMQVAVLGWPMKTKEPRKQSQGDEQDLAESLCIGLDSGRASVLHKDPGNPSGDDGEANSCASQSPP